MRLKRIIAIACCSILLTSCQEGNSGNSSIEEQKDIKQAEVLLDSNIRAINDPKTYKLEFTYENKLFEDKSNEFNSDLAMLSYGCAIANKDKASITSFLNDLEFSRLKFSDGYISPSIDSVGYVFGQKLTDKFNLVCVSMRGFEYKLEWANNFDIGEKGNHKGFDSRATDVLQALKSYLNELNSELPLKLWISGYSRGGAIANVLASKILTARPKIANVENVFVYTFEAARGLKKDAAIAYENVFNIINKADVITMLPPEEYDLFRCGIDIDIYSKSINDYLDIFDPSNNYPSFVAPNNGNKDDVEVAESIISMLLKNPEDEEKQKYSIATRELYNENYADTIKYLFTLISSASDINLSDLMTSFQSLSMLEILSLISSKDNFIDYIKSLFSNSTVTVLEQELSNYLTDIYNFISNTSLIDLITLLTTKNIVPRMIGMHQPDVNYVLLKNYLNK